MAEGMMAKGNRNNEGVFHVIERRDFEPFLIEKFMLSNCFQRVEPRQYRINEITDFQTLPTPTIEKYHPRNQLIHSAPRYLIIVYSPTRAPEAI